jgi:hypothetical protein
LSDVSRKAASAVPTAFAIQKKKRIAAVAIDQQKADGIHLKVPDHVTGANDEVAVVDRDRTDIKQNGGEKNRPAGNLLGTALLSALVRVNGIACTARLLWLI